MLKHRGSTCGVRLPCYNAGEGRDQPLPSTQAGRHHTLATSCVVVHYPRIADTAAYKTTCDGNKDCGPLFCHPEGVSLPSLCPYGLRYARGLNPVSVTETSQPFVFGFTRTAVRTPHAKVCPPRRTGEMAATDYHVGAVTVSPVLITSNAGSREPCPTRTSLSHHPAGGKPPRPKATVFSSRGYRPTPQTIITDPRGGLLVFLNSHSTHFVEPTSFGSRVFLNDACEERCI